MMRMFGAPSAKSLRLDAFLVDGILHRQPRSGGGRRGWEGQDFLRPCRWREQRAQRKAEDGQILVWFHDCVPEMGTLAWLQRAGNRRSKADFPVRLSP